MARQLRRMKNRTSLHTALVDQCCYGLKDPVSGKWYRKRTALDVNDEQFAKLLEKGLLWPSTTLLSFDLQRNYYCKHVVLFQENSILLLSEHLESSGW